MKVKNFVLFALLAVVSLSSCGKYEEGPGLSLRSKKNRLANTWLPEAIEIDGKNVTAELASNGELFNEIEFKEDGSFMDRYTGLTEKGSWEFISDKEKIKLVYEPQAAVTVEFTIKKLQKNSLWLEEEVDVLGVKTKVLYKLKAKDTVY